jgi:hypothetical protein
MAHSVGPASTQSLALLAWPGPATMVPRPAWLPQCDACTRRAHSPRLRPTGWMIRTTLLILPSQMFWYQSHYGCNTSHMILFLKTTVRICLDAHIVVLIGGKLTEIYFVYLLSAIYFSVMTHLRQGKKVSILLWGDINPGPVPSRQGLLEDNSYCSVGAMCPSCDESRPHT